MWEEEEENVKISSPPNLALSPDEAAGMALAAVVLHNPALFCCSIRAVALHSTEEMHHFHQQTGSLKLFALCAFVSLS